MQVEFEATFTNIDKNSVRAQLNKIGAIILYPEFLMKRVVFDPPVNIKGGWMRVRQEANKITLSLKMVDGEKIENQHEAELVIDDFDKGVSFLEYIGANKKAYQETKREMWAYKGCEICIDTWPGLNPFVEIEGPSEGVIKEVSRELGFDYAQAFFGAVGGIYLRELQIPEKVINDETPKITFENPPKRYENR